MRFGFLLLFAFILCTLPTLAGAHEVYVLTPAQITHDITTPSPNPFNAFDTNRFQFFLWGFIAFVLVSTVFFASITHRFEIFFEPYLTRIRPWAALVARITLGLCLLASAYNNALFGPELPLGDFGSYMMFARMGLYVSGIFVLLGLFTRYAAVLASAVFVCGIFLHGSYMLNYTNYAGEMLVVLLLGGGRFALDSSLFSASNMAEQAHRFEPYAFLALRIAFGISVAFASIYAKFIHSNLALNTISQYHLTNFFHFDPLFIVLGACIIEVMMGIFFIVGFEIRHTSLFFLFWIFLSLLYFGESVWPHLVLVGVNAALFMYGYDKFTLQGRFFNKGTLQPFL